MKKIKLFETASCDSGGCGRYGDKRFFLKKEDAEQRTKELHGCYGMVTEHVAYKDGDDILLGEDDGAYTRKQRVTRLALTKSEEAAILKRVKSILTEEEQWVFKNCR